MTDTTEPVRCEFEIEDNGRCWLEYRHDGPHRIRHDGHIATLALTTTSARVLITSDEIVVGQDEPTGP